MPGVRLVHPTLKSCMYTVEHPRPYLVPLLCATCQHVHENKTYHLWLDSQGSVTVSEAVHERLKEIGLAGLRAMNEVHKPPPLIVGAGGPTPQIFYQPLNGYLLTGRK